MKNFTNSVFKSVFSLASVLILSQALSAQVTGSGVISNATTALQSVSDGGNDIATNSTCNNLSIVSITTTNLSGCFTADGGIKFQIADGIATSGALYDIKYMQGGKPKSYEVKGLLAENGIISIGKLPAGRFWDFKIKRLSDGCVASTPIDVTLTDVCNTGSAVETGCGTGTFSFTNCRNQTITVNRANITPNTYIFTSYDDAGTINFVDASCNLVNCQPVNCIDENAHMPAPSVSSAYDYGLVTFTRVVGHVAAGITELQAERLNWMYCNTATSDWRIRYAVWAIMDGVASSSDGGLSAQAIAAVPSVQGGIGSQMVFFIPNPGTATTIQRFVQDACFTNTCNNFTNGGTIGSNQSSCSASFDPAAFTNAASPSGGSGVIEYSWVRSTTYPCPAATDASWQVISGATLVTYDPGVVTQNTCFMRRSRRVGCTTWVNSNAVSVTLSSAPSASISGTQTICSGASSTFTATGGGTYLWSTGATSAAIPVNTAGTYTVTVTNNGCTATATRTLTVTASPSVSITGNQTICTGGSSTFTATGGGTYLWSTGATSAAIPVNIAGTYTVTVTNNGCTATASRSLTINTSPSATATSATICVGQSATITAGGGGTYAWSNGLGSAASITVTPSSTTSYTVTVTSANGCAATAVGTVTVLAKPQVTSLTLSASSVCAGTPVTVTSVSSGGSVSYWASTEGGYP